ncbi:MAG TPA: hypothetical protein VKU84_10080 [Stellaceae bacterium]|nr:hypothetical protein [Stellaceae bacterium]
MTGLVLTFQAVLWLSIALAFIGSRNASIFHPFTIYLVFHGMVFVFRPILENVLNFDRTFFWMMFYPTDDQIQTTLILTSLALVVFALASWVLVPAEPRFDRRLPGRFTTAEWWALGVVVTLLSPVIAYSLYASLTSATPGDDVGGALIQMDRDVNSGIATYTNTTGYIAEAEKCLGGICVMVAWGSRFRLWSFIPLVFYVTERTYIGWSRWTIVLTVMMVILVYIAYRRRRWMPIGMIAIALPTFLLFQQLGENRDAFKQLVLGTAPRDQGPVDNRNWLEKQDGPDFANFDFLTYVMDVVPEKTGTYTYFAQNLQLFTEPIPRILWPNKPIGEPIKFFDLNDYGNFEGLTWSLVGDGWISGGWLGVVITMIAVGYGLGRLHRWFWRGDATHFKILAYCTLLPLTVLTYRDGVISIAKFAFFTMTPLMLWHIVVQAHLSLRRARADQRTRLMGRAASPLQVGNAIGAPTRQS